MNYIWDLDGTLIDSYDVIVSSLVDVAASAGVKDAAQEILRLVKTGSVSGYLRQLSSRTGEDYEALYAQYRSISHERDDRIQLIPGAKMVLHQLQQQGGKHFVYTHRGASTAALLDRLHLSPFFQEVVTWENGFAPKPSGEGVRYLVEKYHLDPAETAYIGDRSIDIGCGKDAGVIAILYQPADSCVLPTGQEDLIIDRLEQLCVFYATR
ncbi:MAG: HAD hydrolase-like protein [Clostridia bacterium]|nr:HAD hydrolase-like protein [Clostridia bacterium]